MKSKWGLQVRSGRRARKKSGEKAVETETFDAGVFSKFKRFLNEQRLRDLKVQLHEFYGKNFPINYRSDYNFNEEWQNHRNKPDHVSDLELINKTPLGISLSLLIMTLFTASIWTTNLHTYFAHEHEETGAGEAAKIAALIGQGLDVCLKLWFSAAEEMGEGKAGNGAAGRRLVKLLWTNAVCCLYLLLWAVGEKGDGTEWACLEVAAQVLMFLRARRIYESLHYFRLALRYEEQFKAADMVLNLLIFAHFMSIVLFQVTRMNPETNWYAALSLHEPTPLTTYAYSFYFCTTTILTVGYGDITPKNPTEIVVVTCLEIIGIIIFGYLVNEIGYNLSALRKRGEAVKKELILMQKMRKYYRLDDELLHKASTYLINREPESDQLSPTEETALMAKLNEDLRNEISMAASLSIVKSSIFFLCRWSKSMQNSVAARLVHVLFSPGEQIYQPEGKERIYLVRLGRIGVFTERRGSRLGNKSVLKEIAIGLHREVTDNSYGYTAVMSARPVRLYAISKDYTSAYYIEKQKFNECINSKSADFEYYHEVKNRIDQSQLWESLEVPSLSNTKHHYAPTKLHVIRKAKGRSLTQNVRLPFVRTYRRLFRGSKNILHDPEELKDIHRVFIPSLEDANLEDTIKKTKANSANSIPKITTIEDIENFVLSFDIKKLFHHYFEAAKEYSNYFVAHNIAKVLKKLDNEYSSVNRLPIVSLCSYATLKHRYLTSL